MLFAAINLTEHLGPYAWLFAAAGAVLGVVASMWSKAKGLAWRVVSLFIQRIEIPTEAAHEAVVAYLIANYKRSRNYDRMYGGRLAGSSAAPREPGA